MYFPFHFYSFSFIVFVFVFRFTTATEAVNSFDSDLSCAQLQRTSLTPAYAENCVPRIWDEKQEQRFERCKNEMCLVYIDQGAHVILNETKVENDEDFQFPVPCRELFEQGKVRGIIFEILSELPEHHYCVWGGRTAKCGYNDFIPFLKVMSSKGYKFANSNYMIDLPERRCQVDIGASLSLDNIVLVGRLGDGVPYQPSISRTVRELLQPFQTSTWLLFLGISLIIVITAVVFTIILSNGKQRGFGSATDAMLLLLGSQESLKLRGGSEAVFGNTSRIFIVKSLRAALFSLVTILLMFYELSIVNSLLWGGRLSTGLTISGLSNQELQSFCVINNTATETVWRSIGTYKSIIKLFDTALSILTSHF